MGRDHAMIGYAIWTKNYSIRINMKQGNSRHIKKAARSCPYSNKIHANLFEQVSANTQVTTTLVLPLASHMVILRTFCRSTFSDFMRYVSHAVVVTAKGNRIKRHHLCGSRVVQFLNLSTIIQGDSLTFTG